MPDTGRLPVRLLLALLGLALVAGGAALVLSDPDPEPESIAVPSPGKTPPPGRNAETANAAEPDDAAARPRPAWRELDADGPLGTPRGHYFGHVHEKPFEQHELSCLMLSPHVAEAVPDWTPAGFVLKTRAGAPIASFVRAMGEPPPAFADAWKRVRTAVGTTEGPPLRVFTRRWARPDLPGRCVTVAVTFYDVPDPFIGATGYGPWPGILFDVRKTYQLAGGETRLVEAAVEEHTDVGRGRMREPHLLLAGVETASTHEVAHFEDYGAGRRRVHLWIDRSWGAREEPDVFARRILAVAGRSPPRIEVEQLPDGDAAALRAFVERA